MMTTRRWWLTGAAAALVVAIAVATGVWALRESSPSDCAAVREMIAYNQRYNETLRAALGSDEPTEPPLSDYQEWADTIGAYSERINDPQLAPRARAAAEIATRSVDIMTVARTDTSSPTAPGIPAWAREYAAMDADFTRELGALERACAG